MKENQSKFSSFKRLWFIMLLSCIGALTSFAQERTVTGTVLDDMGEPAIGATVKVPGTGIGTMTDMDGNYSLKVPSDASQLEFSYVGLETQTLPITGGKIDVKLGQSTKQLKEVVVMGEKIDRKSLTAAVASVGADQIKNIPVTNAAEALQGKLTGVSVTTTEGSPDADVKIRVRGGSSLTQSSNPLYIVDGMPVASINDISPSDIQQIDVLKDASSTAIYGAQGANGVIIITTKDADEGDGKEDCGMQFNVDYTGYMGWKNMSKSFDVLDARDFALMQYEYAYLTKKGDNSQIKGAYNKYFDKAYVDKGTEQVEDMSPLASIRDVDGKIIKLGILDSIAGVGTTDWQDKAFGRTALTSNHSFTISGGNKKASFTFSYNRIDDEGIMRESDYTRNNFNLKAKYKPFKGFTIGTNVRYTNTTVLGSGANTADDAGSKRESRVENAIAYTPIQLLATDNSILDDEESYGSMYDPLTTIRDNYKFKRDNKWDLNAYASYNFLKKFTARVDLGYRAQNTRTDRYYGKTAYYSREGDGKTGAGGETGRVSGIRTLNEESRFLERATFEYKDKFNGGHNFSVFVGEEAIINKGEQMVLYGWGYEPTYDGESLFKHLGQYNAPAITQYIDPTDNMLSFFGKVNYDYKGRYYFTATMRADASTRFSKENQWGYFPAASLAWRISDEPWMQAASRAAKMSNLKLRLSYGVAGNNNVDLGYLHNDYTSSATTYISDKSFEHTSSILAAGGSDKILANPDLKWETTTTRDIGLDYGFFRDRLSGALDLYWNSTDDLIIKFKTPSFYNYQYRNVAETKNLGVEFSVKGVILEENSKKLNYDLTVDANISANKNTVVSLGGMENYIVSTGYLSAGHYGNDAEFLVEEGESVGRIYGFETDGIYTANDFASYDVTNMKWLDASGNPIETPVGITTVDGGTKTYAYPGLLKLKDKNGDGKINSDDRTIIGCTMPDFTGGFSISGHVGGESWGSVDAALNFTYSYGNDVLNLTGMRMSMIQDKTKLRNTLATTSYSNRYSLFKADGTYIPAGYSGVVTGEAYTNLANELASYNAGKTQYNPVMSNSVITDQCVEDGSFLRLANLTIGYSLPDKWISKAHITKARIFFTASNLFVLTKYTGSDPEVDTGTKVNPLAIGVDYSAYPKSRAFNFGLNLSF